MAEAGIKASITAAIVANLMTAFLCFKVGEVSPRSGFGLAPWQGPTKAFHFGAAPVRAAIIAIRLARAYTTLFLSSLIL